MRNSKHFLAKPMDANNYYHYSYFKNPSRQAEKCLLVSDGMAYTADTHFRIERKSFHNYLAFYVHKGTFHVEQYGKTYIFRQGEGALLNLMDSHIYYSDPNDTAHLLWFHFRGGGMTEIMKLLSSQQKLPYSFQNPALETEFLKAFHLTSVQAAETELAGHLYQTIMKILQNFSFSEEITTEIPAPLREAVSCMETQICGNLSLEELSRNVGMGKYHFSHMFKEWYGTSPMFYYNSRKMETACNLLKDDAYTIEEIAFRMGYSDSSYFRKAFKNYFGITPSAYRKIENPL